MSKRLRLESQEMAGLITHNGERGTANEFSLGSLLMRSLPPSVRVATGEIIDGRGGVSPQMDTVILSNTVHPVIFAQTEERLFPIESVLLCVEVKSTLTSGEVSDIAAKVRKFRALHSNSGVVPEMAVFAHRAGSAPSTVAKWFFELEPEERPEFFIVNDSALIGGIDTEAPGGYRVAMPFLPKSGEDKFYNFGDPLTHESGFWKPADKPKGMQVRIDHGAALLYFLNESLKALSRRNHAEIDWLDSYLAQIPKQHVVYEPGKEASIVTD
ncbi:DUF6602 domain-containing protein (plasmid) [Glutamicibacter sp. PAEs-4]|uniref:DUF6602 domain-containing protein n=1 Tax=Glutamicibacter sp. PAEs-4 TaxID=3444114 RepID=UPI003EC01F02